MDYFFKKCKHCGGLFVSKQPPPKSTILLSYIFCSGECALSYYYYYKINNKVNTNIKI